MSDKEIIDTIADILPSVCGDWSGTAGASRFLLMFRAAGYAVVKLPRPQPDKYGNQGFRAGDGEFADFVLPLPDGDVFDGEYTWTPAEARARAAALWAAADKAEEGK